MIKTFNDLRGESAVINACQLFTSNTRNIPVTVFYAALSEIENSTTIDVYQEIVKQLYIELLTAVIKATEAFDRMPE